MSGTSLCPAFRHRLRSLWHQFFGTIALIESVLKSLCQQLCSFSLAPCQRSYACPMAQGLETLASLGRTIFRNNRIDEIVLKNPCQQLCSFSLAPCQRSYARPIAQCLHAAWQVLGAQFFGTVALMEFVLKTRANSSRFSLYRSLPTELSPSYFSQFPVHVHASIPLPPNRALPKLFPTVSHPSTVHASVSLPPNGALPKGV